MSDMVCHLLRSVGKYRFSKASFKWSKVSFWSSSSWMNQDLAAPLKSNGSRRACALSFKFLYFTQSCRYVNQSRGSSVGKPEKNVGFINDVDADETTAVINSVAAARSVLGGSTSSETELAASPSSPTSSSAWSMDVLVWWSSSGSGSGLSSGSGSGLSSGSGSGLSSGSGSGLSSGSGSGLSSGSESGLSSGSGSGLMDRDR